MGAYSLSGIFEAAADGNIPDRIKAAFLQPADLDDPSIGSEFPMEEITDDDIADEPDNITDEGYRKTNERDSGGGAMGPYTSGGAEETFYESVEDDPSNDSIQPTSIEKETTAYGSIAESGTWIYRSVTVPANMPSSSSQRLKLVVSVIPEVEGDVFVLRWEGSNTESDNFWYHNIGDSYYLTASLSSSRGQRSYTYQIRYSHGVRGSDGNFTVKTYWIVDDSSSEDFDSRDGVNDNATTAESATDIGRGYKTFTGKIDHPLDYDFYLIYVGNNEKVSASLESPTGKDYCVSIIDHDGRTENVSASAYLDGWYKPGKSYAFASINTGTKYEEYMLVEVYGIDGDYSPDSTYTLTITQNRISASGDLELNDKFIDADDKMSAFTSQYLGTSTKSATAIEFCIDTPTDRDRYAIYLNAGDKISMEMRLPDEYNDSYYQYRLAICSDVVSTSDNVSWKQRTYNNPDSTHSKSAAYIADTAGTYYVSVSSETRKCDMLMDGLLLITKTPASSMDSYEDKGFNCTNDFVFSTLIRLNSTDLGINGATKMSGRISSTFDNELDVDWFEYVNNSSRSKNSLISLMDGASVVDGGGLIVLDANYNLLSDGEEGLVYNLSPYTTYYIGAYVREGGYQRRVTNYTLAVEELPPFSASVSNFKINGDDGAMLGYGNKVSFDLYTSGAVIFPYTIKLSMGWDSGNMFEKASQRISLRDGTQTVEFDDIALTGNGANLKTRVTVILGNAEMHTSQLYRQEVTKVMPSDLMLDKSDGNELYVNNPETITDEDVIYPGQYNNKTNNLIYQQEGITGTNTLYITHSTKEGNEKPSYEFYYDVDFYNPSASPVNITLKRPYAAANDGWDGYINLRELYLERLWDDHETATVTIPAGGHRLLFQDVVPEVFGGAKGFTVRPSHCYVAIFADFTVPKGKEITVSSLAAYSPEYLRLSGDGGQQYAGTDVKLPISGSPFVMSHRDIEDDIYLKMKGRDANGVNTVSANLSYIINDNISDCRLPLYIRDEFYGLDFKNRQEQWIANLNPINDQYDARYYSAPSSLPSYSYDSGDGGTYLFDFQYLNPYAEYTDTYAAPQIGDIRNYPLNNTILNYFRRAALTGVAEPYPSGVEQDYLNDMTMACGSWGVTHKYTLDVTNSGSKWRTLNYHLIMKNFAAILYTVRDAKTGETIEYDGLTLESEAYKTDHDVFRVVLPPGARYTITFSTLNGVGTAGFGNYLELGTIY